MSVIRSFIAISLSPEIYQHLDEASEKLRSRLPETPVRWVPVKNIHLTIKFLGNVSVSNLEMLKKVLEVEVGRHAPFEISVGEVGAFPSNRRPRVLWIGVEAPPELYALQRGIEAEMARLGYAREEREFSPHLTLGRVARNAGANDLRQISQVLDSCKVGFLGATRVQEVRLYRSDLQPGGAVYTQIFAASLAAGS
ncbi:MAG: RNA 2',3'-cyclic phosphodiesterase [Chloroflexota bacterium]